MRIQIATYKIVCDCCGRTFENGLGWVCYCDDPNEIENDASSSGWVKTEDGHHYCENCHEWDDNDILVCKDGKKYNENFKPLEE